MMRDNVTMKHAGRKYSGRKSVGAAGFAAVTVLLVLLITGLCVETVKCRNDVSVQEMELFYAEKEQELVHEAKALLRAEGYENSGVMLTRVVEADGSRQYTLTVHHGRINRLNEAERRELLEKLGGINFGDEEITIFHEFLASR